MIGRKRTYAELVGFSVFTGASFHAAKYTVGYLSPYAAGAWRFGIAAAVLLIILLLTEGFNPIQVRKYAVWYMLLGIVGIFGFSAAFFAGLQFTSSINGALIMALNPLFTTILARAVLKEKLTARHGIGTFIALTGVMLVIFQGSYHAFVKLQMSVGDIFLLLGSVCWTCYGVLLRRFVREGSSLSSTAYTMAVGSLCLAIAALFVPNPAVVTALPAGTWTAILFMALCTSVLGYLWWNKGIKELGAGTTSLFFNLVPIVTMMFSYISGVQVTTVQLIGAFLVVIGIMTASSLTLRYQTGKLPAGQKKLG